jgi:hypothetical protein
MFTQLEETYAIIRQALIERKPVAATYGDLRREFCPHCLGTRNGERRVLGWQYGGVSNHGLPNWRCMNISGLSNVRIVNGPWETGGAHTRPQVCITHVDVEVIG